jgi:glycosyltransferase involved in cell wall biosynthesis
MKIVHIEDFLHPDAGYQLNTLAPLQVDQGHDVTIITGELDKMPSDLMEFFGRDNIPQRDAIFSAETGVKIIRIPLVGFYSGRALFYPRIFKMVSALRPDVVFIHGEDTLTGMVFIRLSKWLRYPLVLDCHMVEMASINRFREYFRRFYKTFITPVIMKENIPLIRVMDSDYVEKCLGIPLECTTFVSFGTDTRLFSPNAAMRRTMREKLGFAQDAFIVLYAGKLDETKGGMILARALALKFPEALGRPIEFLVIGKTNGDYGRNVEEMLSKSENKVIRLPTAKFRELARYYQLVDLALFPRQCSMSFFEVQSCGVPVLFEENEINCQRCVDENAYLFEPGNAEDLRAKITMLAATDPSDYDRFRANSRQFIVNNFDYIPIAQQFTDILARTIMQWQQKGRRTFASESIGA